MPLCCKDHRSLDHDFFISYRVGCDKASAEKFYREIQSRKDRTGRDFKAFWDYLCLVPGESWEVGFQEGLQNSKVIVLLISEDGLENIKAAHQQHDHVLLEYELALQMKREGKANIVPILLARIDTTKQGDLVYRQFKFPQRDQFPNEGHRMTGRNVRDTMNELFGLQGVHCEPTFESIRAKVDLVVQKYFDFLPKAKIEGTTDLDLMKSLLQVDSSLIVLYLMVDISGSMLENNKLDNVNKFLQSLSRFEKTGIKVKIDLNTFSNEPLKRVVQDLKSIPKLIADAGTDLCQSLEFSFEDISKYRNNVLIFLYISDFDEDEEEEFEPSERLKQLFKDYKKLKCDHHHFINMVHVDQTKPRTDMLKYFDKTIPVKEEDDFESVLGLIGGHFDQIVENIKLIQKTIQGTQEISQEITGFTKECKSEKVQIEEIVQKVEDLTTTAELKEKEVEECLQKLGSFDDTIYGEKFAQMAETGCVKDEEMKKFADERKKYFQDLKRTLKKHQTDLEGIELKRQEMVLRADNQCQTLKKKVSLFKETQQRRDERLEMLQIEFALKTERIEIEDQILHGFVSKIENLGPSLKEKIKMLKQTFPPLEEETFEKLKTYRDNIVKGASEEKKQGRQLVQDTEAYIQDRQRIIDSYLKDKSVKNQLKKVTEAFEKVKEALAKLKATNTKMVNTLKPFV